MKLNPFYAGMLILSCATPALAANLSVPNDVELLMVDGKKVPSGLLKSTTHITLPNETSQILFRVEKIVRSGSDQTLFTSTPIVVAFDAKADQNITIELPKLTSESDGKRFNQNLNFRLVDQNGNAVPYKSDVLAIDGLMSSSNVQEALATYNYSNATASVANLAPAITASIAVPVASNAVKAANTAVTQQTVTLQGENVPEQMLQYWFQQADSKTQQRFMNWAKDNARQ